jgi:hypothetical protein
MSRIEHSRLHQKSGTVHLWISISGFESLGGSQIFSISYRPRFFQKPQKSLSCTKKLYQLAREPSATRV